MYRYMYMYVIRTHLNVSLVLEVERGEHEEGLVFVNTVAVVVAVELRTQHVVHSSLELLVLQLERGGQFAREAVLERVLVEADVQQLEAVTQSQTRI